MKILVTGHKGYIGAVLVPFLQKRGHEVHGLDSDLFKECTYGEYQCQIPEKIKDVRQAMLEDVTGYDAIMHLAGLSNDPLGNLNPTLTYEINYKASLRLARLAKQVGVPRFIFSSTCSNYGAAGNDWLTENSPFNPVTPYGKSKVMAEQAISKLTSKDFHPIFLRNATAYGLSPRLRFDLVLNNLVAWAHTTGKVLLKSDGTSWRPIVHIEDISRAFAAVAEAPLDVVSNQAFNVARDDDNYQVRDIANLVAEVVPSSKVELSDDHFPDPRNYKVNAQKIKKMMPSFEPAWTARKGAEEVYQAFLDQGLLPEEFEGPRYQRIAHIKHLLASEQIDHRLYRKEMNHESI